ncbi:MAG: glycosyltransferase family 2 protein [Clostridiales bacterium]|nr:glycosyltransferase family 2 protein [Clostridiales bacterium]
MYTPEENHEKLISLIVPVYNCEGFLEPCLESIIAQDFADAEILLIDDGSTDKSPDICKAYAERDSRIRYIRKENTGVAHTRNIGISLAKGKYLMFSDSDDTLEGDALSSFVNAMEAHNCSIAVSSFYRCNPKTNTSQLVANELNGVIPLTEYARQLIKSPADYYFGVVWNKCYITEIVRNNKLFFNNRFPWGEDFEFNMQYLYHVESVALLAEPHYNYYKRMGSLSGVRASLKRPLQIKHGLFKSYKRLIERLGLFEKHRLRTFMFYITIAQDR